MRTWSEFLLSLSVRRKFIAHLSFFIEYVYRRLLILDATFYVKAVLQTEMVWTRKWLHRLKTKKNQIKLANHRLEQWIWQRQLEILQFRTIALLTNEIEGELYDNNRWRFFLMLAPSSIHKFTVCYVLPTFNFSVRNWNMWNYAKISNFNPIYCSMTAGPFWVSFKKKPRHCRK